MLVVGRVLLALVGAGAAGHRARLDRRAEDAEIGLGLPDEDSAGRIAGIGAVEAEANAADQLLYVRLAEVGVGAARARSCAVDALVDTAQKQVAVEGDGARVRLEHFVNRHVTLLSARAGSVRFYTRHVETREAAQRCADVECGWREHDEHAISTFYADGSFLAAAPFREPEPGYLSRVFEEEESAECEFGTPIVDGPGCRHVECAELTAARRGGGAVEARRPAQQAAATRGNIMCFTLSRIGSKHFSTTATIKKVTPHTHQP